MHAPTGSPSGFKRQVVFRISSEEWPLLEAAAREHGSIQKAVIAGLHVLVSSCDEDAGRIPDTAAVPRPEQAAAGSANHRHPMVESRGEAEEITAREAARLLGVKSSTVSGYIRSGRLPGRYDETLTSGGWLTTRTAVLQYRGHGR